MRGEDKDDYELVAQRDLEELRKDVEEIKRNPVKDYETSVTLIEAIDRLSEQITSLLALFEKANEQMYKEYQDGLHAGSDKLDEILSQNQKIARGILSIAQGDQPVKQEQQEEKKESDMGAAPWDQADEDELPKSRRSLMREFP